METSPIWVLFIHGFATSFIITWLGLLLVNIRPSMKKLIWIGLSYAVMAVVIRSLPISFLAQFGILTLILVIIIMLNWNLSLLKAFVPVVFGTVIMGVGEALSTSAIFALTDISDTYIKMHPLVDLAIPIPQILLCLFIIYLCFWRGWHVLDLRDWSELIPNERRVRAIVVLACTMLSLLLMQIIFNILFNLRTQNIMHELSTESVTALSTIAMVSAFLVMVFLIQQLFILLGKESKYITQTAYMQTLDELHTASQAEAHDRINHMQTLYGFVQLGDLAETQIYLEELIGEIIVTRNYLSTGHPALSALFYIKSGLATSRGIQLDIVTETRVENLNLPSHELNRILGNLINNAFDSVAPLARDERKVFIEVTKIDKKYRFRIGNRGKLDPDIIKNIFNRGYSTKGGHHQGLGLYIVRQLAEKYRGQVRVDNQDGMVVFTVDLPESIRSDSDERFSSDLGVHSGS